MERVFELPSFDKEIPLEEFQKLVSEKKLVSSRFRIQKDKEIFDANLILKENGELDSRKKKTASK